MALRHPERYPELFGTTGLRIAPKDSLHYPPVRTVDTVAPENLLECDEKAAIANAIYASSDSELDCQ